MSLHVDGKANYPSCRCGNNCEFPCWQRVGLADACGACGCDDFDYKPAVISVRPGEPIPAGYEPIKPVAS